MTTRFDVVVIGSGPGGQKAAVCAAKAGRRVAVIEREPVVGGACVHRGTIPSKTLREAAVGLTRARGHAQVIDAKLRDDIRLDHVSSRVEAVASAHVDFIGDQLQRNGVQRIHGRARFVPGRALEVDRPGRDPVRISADVYVIATGSRPRQVDTVPIDHETIFDSDSILSLTYLPQSLLVVGGGIIASEYASIFTALGVAVTQIDRGERPIGYVDPELCGRYEQAFSAAGGSYRPGQRMKTIAVAPEGGVVAATEVGDTFRAEAALVAFGRVANVAGLGLETVGIELTPRGHIPVDAHCKTSASGIYAVGDVVGPPALASTSMEQGRRAMCHALRVDAPPGSDVIPMGIYTIPEIASVGLGETEAFEQLGGAMVGRAEFRELARGHITGITDGMLKMIADPTGERLVGIGVVGEGATELVHLGQLALIHGASPGDFIENIFNFPTLAEAYRVAALDIAGQRARLAKAS